MLSPGGDDDSGTLEASLERAFTSIRPARLAQFKPALSALRSASACAAAGATSRFWRGLEQTTLLGAATPEKPSYRRAALWAARNREKISLAVARERIS
jgi:hypothetical protein